MFAAGDLKFDTGKAFILFARSYIPGPAVISDEFTMPAVIVNG